MSKEIAIRVNSLSKTYKLYKDKRDFIKEAMHPLRKVYHKKFNALNEISFNVNKGEVLGIIGRNGSGKSTLLKILASIVTPTKGSYKCNGRVTALLELGGGFDKDLTGIKNIEFLGAVQGFSKKEMKSRTEDILEFSEIGEYAYQTINTYSSGMYMRLAFSLAINIDPDILIVDEILAVGDIRFQQKCLRKIQEFKDQGKTIVICTQSIETIKMFCTQAMWINEGQIVEINNPDTVTDHYNSFMRSEEQVKLHHKNSSTNDTVLYNRIENIPKPFNHLSWYDITKCESHGEEGIEFKYACICDKENKETIKTLCGGEKIRVLLSTDKQISLEHPIIQLQLNGQYGTPIFKINSDLYSHSIDLNSDKQTVLAFDFEFPKIDNGKYTFSFKIITNNMNNLKYHLIIHDILVIEVANPNVRYRTGSPVIIDEAVIETFTQ